MPAWRMCASRTSSVHKPPKPQHFSMQSLLALQNQHMHLLHYLGGNHELIFQRLLKSCIPSLVWRENICANERNTWFPAQALSFCWNLNMKLTTKLWPNSVLVLNSQTQSKLIGLNPTIQHIVFPSASMHFFFLRSPQHFYTNLSLSNFPV